MQMAADYDFRIEALVPIFGLEKSKLVGFIRLAVVA